MITPRTRLLVAFGLIVVPAAALASAPSAAQAAWLFIGSFVVLAAVDAVLGNRNLDGIALSMPEVVRFVRRRKGVIPVTVRNDGAGISRLHAGIVLSETLGCDADDFNVDLPARGETVTALLAAHPQTRGTFTVGAAALEAASPLGLWSARRRVAVHSEIRVYPDLGADQSLIAPLLNRRNPGLHVQRQAGRGREFEKLREYVPGDALNEIHWKATARRGHPITRQYRVERTQEIYAVLDCSRLTGREAGPGETVLERFITAALVLSLACRQQSDLFGLVTFSDTVHSFVRAGGTHAHYDACRNALLNLTPRLVAPDFAELAATLDTRLRRRAMLVFLTELDDPVLSEDFLKVAATLSRRHLVAVASVRAEQNEALFELPAGSIPEVYERLGGHLAWRRLFELSASLRSRGVRMFTAHPAKLSLELTRFYLNTKQRQAI
jgi:uncharacterized protein (DUF58 family)